MAVLAVVLGSTATASAQAELTGTFIRYLRVGANGALVDIPGSRSMQYSEAGGTTDLTCDLYFPGTPAVGFTIAATPAGGVAASGSNNSFTGDVATLAGPTVVGRAIDWSGRWTSGTIDVRVAQRVEYAIGDRVARLTVTLTNDGAVALTDVYYFFSGDPDHAQCNIGTDYFTLNDIVRQRPTDATALATATEGTPSYTFGIGSADLRARANNGGFENTDAVAAWNTPVDTGGASVDEDIGMAFRELALAPAASTTFVMYLVWGTSVAEVGSRLDAALATAGSNGSPCTGPAGCTSGFCVDGVCCDSACGGGAAGDCQACSVAAGAAADGACGAAAGGTVCRAAMGGACDAAETCDGTSLTCPANAVAPAATECRAAAGACDVAETCDGTTAACPADALAAAATECRASAGDCDVAETCDGTTAACPADAFAAAATECRASAGACDIAEACDGASASCPADATEPDGTACGDGLVCNGDEVCNAGACGVGTSIDCDDGDVCTADMCTEPAGTCANVAIDGCCMADTDCDDGDPCTMDACATNTCANAPILGCGGDTDGGAGDEDASVSGADAGTGGADAGTGSSSGGGCSCRAVGSSGRAPAGALLLALAVFGLVLRRRRR